MSDLISRQEAIDALKQHYWNSELQKAKDDPCVIDAMTDLDIRIIKALPSVQPRKGKWTIDPGIGCKCSNCGFDIGNDLDFMEYVNFCPHCGADMRGEEQ